VGTLIAYVEVRDKYSRLPFALIEPAECWFELAFYGVGQFQVYTRATDAALAALKEGNYITIPNKPYIWVIEGVNATYEARRGYMISATGRQAKAILGKRIINRQTQLSGDLTTAVFKLIRNHAGENAGDVRKIDGLAELTSAVVKPITATQVSYSNLLDYTDTLLQAYGVGAELTITDAAAFRYNLYEGVDRSGEIIFSQTFDNLLSSSYTRNVAAFRSVAIIGGQGEGNERILHEYDAAPTFRGVDRAEIFVDAKDISNKYTDESGTEQELDLTTTAGLATYKAWLEERGRQKTAESAIVETFEGEIDTEASAYQFGTHYNLGDRVRVQDDYLGAYITPRILKMTMKQDRKYSELVEYGG
jgi:hypothetical protein